MPIKNSTTGNIPYLESYEPFKLTNGLVEASTISEMISYDIKPSDFSTSIEYVLGSQDLYIKALNIKNITTNADVELSIRYFKNLFFVNYGGITQTREFGTELKEIKTILSPGTNAKFDIVLNNALIDAGIYRNSVNANLVVVARNLQNGNIITKRTDATVYENQYFPRRVRIE
jgi:hypothetical protein